MMKKILCLLLSLLLTLCFLPDITGDCCASAPECTTTINGVTTGDILFTDAVLNAATNGDVTSITLTDDVLLSTDIVFATGSDIEINLAGHNITGTFTFKNYGILNIKDSLLSGTVSSNDCTIEIHGGSLIIYSGTISSTADPTIWIIQNAGSTVTIKGGSVNGKIGVRVDPGNTFILDGGNISNAPSDTRIGVYLNGNNAKCIVSSGNISAKKNSISYGIYMVDACECNILGGNISGKKYGINSTGDGCILNVKSGVISGGTAAVYDKVNIVATYIMLGDDVYGTNATYSDMTSYSDITVSSGDFYGAAAKHVTASDLTGKRYMKAIYNPPVIPTPPADDPEPETVTEPEPEVISETSSGGLIFIDWDTYRNTKDEKKELTIEEATEYLLRDVKLAVRTEYEKNTVGKIFTRVNVYIENEDYVSEYIDVLKAAGYTFGYRYYRSDKRYDGFSKMITKREESLYQPYDTYLNTKGKNGIRYYYRAALDVYEPNSDYVAFKTDYRDSKCGYRVFRG